MDGANSNKNYYDFNFRPQSGNSSSPKPHKNKHNASLSSKPTVSYDETTVYAVNLLLKPVEMGIIAVNNGWRQEFKGLGAFNHYFGLLAPSKSLGYTLPDIWDGYFHITLVKFFSRLKSEQLEDAFRTFTPSSTDLPYIPDIPFQASRINIFPGNSRTRDRQNIDFVVLPIDSNAETTTFYENVLPLLDELQKQTESTKWTVTPINGLHVTVRKYSNLKYDLNKIKIREFPLQFRCSHLEVKQSREQAIDRFKMKAENEQYRWWTGVTEINKKCSGCKTRIMSDNWEGFCLTCGKYESIIPIWSTDGRNISYYHQIQLQEQMQNNNNTLSGLVHQHLNLNES
jgi:hypothetical protein